MRRKSEIEKFLLDFVCKVNNVKRIMIKVSSFLLLLFIMSFPCYADNQNDKTDASNVVILKYKNIINNLKVEVIWNPIDRVWGNLVGPAIMLFVSVKDGSRSTIVNNKFGICSAKLSEMGLETEKDRDGYNAKIKNKNKIIHLDYIKPVLNEKGLGGKFGDFPDVPFFFYDLDFGNHEELIVREANNGQRWHHTYKVYPFDGESIISSQGCITYKEPYLSLDGLSVIDRSNKTITIHSSGGARYYDEEIYKFHPTKNKYLRVRSLFWYINRLRSRL